MKLFPDSAYLKSPAARLVTGLLSLLFGGLGLLALIGNQRALPTCSSQRIFQFLAEEVLMSVLLFFSLGFFWCLWASACLDEMLFTRKLIKTLGFGILLGALLACTFCAWLKINQKTTIII